MLNYAYAGFWLRGYGEANMLEDFGKFLELFPYSTRRPGLHSLTIWAVDAAQAALMQRDYRREPLHPDEWLEVAQEFLHEDSAYGAIAYWDLWALSTPAGVWQWRLEPQPIEIICHGTMFDSEICQELGHFHVVAGPEHLFLGWAEQPLLEAALSSPQPVGEEAQFVNYMSDAAHHREYLVKTQDNIRRLLAWARKVERSLPVERMRLWSEGEQDFRERMEAILAVAA